MQVNCPKCSRPILVTDVIESSGGRLSIPRPDPEDRSLLFVYCFDHVVAQCVSCNRAFRMAELGADALGGGRTNLCPGCREGHRDCSSSPYRRRSTLGNEHVKRAYLGM
jgi:hypothetical protein